MDQVGIYALLFCSWIGLVTGQICSTEFFGYEDPDKRDGKNEKEDNVGYIMNGAPSTCCGVVESWWASFKDTKDDQPVEFSVWRPTGTPNEYTIIGQNIVSRGNNGDRLWSITGADVISVRSGDVFGWWSPGQEILAYDDKGESSVTMIIGLADLGVGDTHDWTGGTAVTANTYAFRVDVGPGASPTFPGSPYTGTISSTEAAGVTVGTVTITDDNPMDVDGLTMTMDTNAEFTFNPTSGEVITSTITTLTGTITLSFTVTDECGNTGTGTMVVTVLNTPPVISLTPESTTVSEDSTGGESIFDITVTDADPLTCDLSTTAKAAGVPFEVQLKPGSTDYAIYVASPPGFDYNTLSVYEFTVECTGGVTTVESGSFFVNLLKNEAPSFINIQNSTVISSTLGIGGSVFTVLASDPENDDLDYALTCEIVTCPFTINANGEIKLTRDISSEFVVAYDVSITVTDGKNTVGPTILTVSVGDLNNPVTFTNLPIGGPIAIPENSAAGTSIYTVAYTDVDAGQTHTYWMTASPTDMLPFFNIATDGKITTTAPINLEALASSIITLDVTVSDMVVQDTQQLQVQIVNVNEAPAFGGNNFSLSATDGLAGTNLGTPPFGITDPDSGDSYNLTMNCGDTSSYFYMNPSTGAVSYQSDFDYDADGALPRTANCIVTVTDVNGLTDTATLRIDIADINDNVPVFNPQAYDVYISAYAGIGPVLTVTATDGDRGTFGAITYSLNQNLLSSPQFTIAQDGVVSLSSHVIGPNSALNHSSTYTLTAIATDSAGESATALITVVISDTTTTTQATTTGRFRTFFDEPANWAWFVPCMLLLAVTLAITGWVVYTCKGKYGWDAFKRNFFKERGRGKRAFRPGRNPIDQESVRKAPPKYHSWQKTGGRGRY